MSKNNTPAVAQQDEKTLSVQERLEAAAPNLTPADRRIWGELSRDRSDAVYLSTDAIASAAAVNQASVVRFAQKLGFSGFVAFRDALRSELRDTSSPSQRLRKLVDAPHSPHYVASEAGAQGALGVFLAHQADTLALAATTVSEDSFTMAAQQLAEARTIYVFASGHATTLAELACRRLTRIGCSVVDLRGAPRDLIEHVAAMGDADALLAFGFRKMPRHLGALLDVACESGAAIIAITDVLVPDMARSGATILSASRGRSGDYQTLTVPLAVLEALSIAVAKLCPDRGTQALERIEALAHRFDQKASHRPASISLDKRRTRDRIR